jgi:hypothetical protein
MVVSLETEKRRSRCPAARFGSWVRWAEGYRGTCHRMCCMEVPVKPRRPPSLPLICLISPDHSSFSVLRETTMTSAIRVNFNKLKCHGKDQEGR